MTFFVMVLLAIAPAAALTATPARYRTAAALPLLALTLPAFLIAHWSVWVVVLVAVAATVWIALHSSAWLYRSVPILVAASVGGAYMGYSVASIGTGPGVLLAQLIGGLALLYVVFILCSSALVLLVSPFRLATYGLDLEGGSGEEERELRRAGRVLGALLLFALGLFLVGCSVGRAFALDGPYRAY